MTPSLLIVDDHPGTVQLIARATAGLGRQRFASGGRDALAQMVRNRPDLVLLDAELPDLSGFEVLAIAQQDEDLRDIPVIIVTGHADHDVEVRGLELGAVDFITKPISTPVLQARVRTHLRLKLLSDTLRRNATIDSLTGVLNRQGFEAAISREWRRALRDHGRLSLLMVDVDHFKRYNDHYGHVAGDLVLRRVADALLGSVLRPGDVVARYGGEEFAVILPGTHRAGAAEVAARILENIAALDEPHAGAPSGRLSASIGIGESRPARAQPIDADRLMAPVLELIEAADAALYEAKARGRCDYAIADAMVF